MRHIGYIAVVGASLIAAQKPAAAADAMFSTMVFGGGTDSCGAWTQGREAAGKTEAVQLTQQGLNRAGRENWVLGYLTAVTTLTLPRDRVESLNLLEGTDTDGVMAWIDNFCRSNPLTSLNVATDTLASELKTRWLAAHPPRK